MTKIRNKYKRCPKCTKLFFSYPRVFSSPSDFVDLGVKKLKLYWVYQCPDCGHKIVEEG